MNDVAPVIPIATIPSQMNAPRKSAHMKAEKPREKDGMRRCTTANVNASGAGEPG